MGPLWHWAQLKAPPLGSSANSSFLLQPAACLVARCCMPVSYPLVHWLGEPILHWRISRNGIALVAYPISMRPSSVTLTVKC